MIRKDVKLGFAIGGVLLAVLVVYVLVGTGGEERGQNNGAGIVTEDTSQSSVGSHTAGPPNNAPTNSHDVHPPTNATGAAADASRGGAAVPPATDTSLPPATPTPKPEVAAQEQRDPNRDLWGKALNEGQLLMSETPTPVGGISARSPGNTGTTSGAQGDSNTNSTPATDDSRPRVTDASPMFGSASTQPSAFIGTDSRETSSSIGGRTHVVQKNETLAKISLAAYGSANYYPHILRANPGLDPMKLKPGMTINLPAASEVKPTATDSASGPTSAGPSSASHASVDPRTEYRVESNDSLYKIAMKLYGKPTMMDKLYELNKDTIGPDRAKLKLNMVLKLPEPPTETAAR
jgi:nucleoid-associated protein YgaU